MTTRILIACLLTILLIKNAYAQSRMENISGEGEVIKQEITLDPLTGINLGFSGDVVLTPGNTQKIILEGQQNILDNIKRDVRGGTWNINFEKNVHNAKKVTVYVTLPSLREVGLSGSGDIHSTDKFSGLNTLNINVSGSGHITLAYDGQSTDLHLSGSGGINLAGASKSLEISISGSGNVKASDLVTEDCEIHISGSGNASVQANNNLETHISGSGDVTYSGNASVTTRISGSGGVTKIKQ